MKYMDYMDLGKGQEISTNEKDFFMDYFKWLLDTNYKEMEDYFLSTFKIIKFPNLSEDEIVQGAIYTTIQEEKDKYRDKNFYFCNYKCALKTVKKIFTKGLYEKLSQEETPIYVISRYRAIMYIFLLDLDELRVSYNNFVLNKINYNINNYNSIHCMPLYQVLLQVLYGTISFHSFSDIEILPSIGIIRQLIELRIRRAFGVICYEDNKGNIYPLDFSKLLDSIKRHSSKIIFPIDLSNIVRIYKWANLYIHSGVRCYSWIPFFIETYIKDLICGKWDEGFGNVNNAIETDSATIKQIHKELEATEKKLNYKKIIFNIYVGREKEQHLKLKTCEPECKMK